LEEIVGSEDNPFLLDETVVFFERLGGYEKAMDYLQIQSEKRQVGLRLHNGSNQNRDDLRKRGFEIVEIGKIPYAEFKAIFDSHFEGTGFSLPERFVQYGHTTYDLLAESVWYVAEAFRLLIENPETELSETKVKESVEKQYMWFKV